MKAFVTQENPRLNYTGLSDHTDDVVFVTAHDFNSMSTSESNRMLVDSIRRKLSDYHPDDCIVPSGSPLVTAVVVAIALEKSGKINVLRWSNMYEKYFKFTLEIGHGN